MIQKQEFVETEIGKIPKDWNFDKLGNHLIIKGRIGWKGLKKSEYEKEGYAIINGEQIVNDSIDWDSCGRITKERYDESPEIMLNENDILMTKDGTIGKLAYLTELKEPTTVASGVFVIRNNSTNLNQKYLYYVFKSNFFKNLVVSRTEGSVVSHLYQRDIVELKIPLPPIQEQRKIAEVFFSLDDKIALNRSMNSTLEAIGQALFKHWFVDFEFHDEEGKPYRSSGGEMVETELGDVPRGWEVKPFSEVIDVNPNRKLVKDRHAKKVGMADLNAWQSWVESWQLEEYKSGPRFQNGDTLFARITPSLEHGKTAFVSFLDKDEVTFGSTEFIIFAPKIIQSNLYIFHLSRSEYVREAAIGAMTGSSGRQRVPDGLFDQLLICVPSLQIIDTFHKAVSPFFEEIAINANQNRNLTTLRDALLPKLMSGEIRVNVEPKEVKNETMG